MTDVVDLPGGPLEYVDSGGDCAVVVLLHGLLMDATLWDAVVDDLSRDHRCIAPTLPLGAHRRPMPEDADVSLPGQARLVEQLLDHLDVHDVTLVGNDTGGAVAQVLLSGPAPRIGRAVLASCEAFDNLPPGLTGRALFLAGKMPPWAFAAFLQQLRLRVVRRLPLAFGWLTRRGDATTAGWIRPAMTRAGSGQAVRALRAVFSDRTLLERAAELLPGFTRPVLVVWASEDRVMPPEHGRRLAGLFPHAELVEIEDSYTLLPLDQPARFSAAVRTFVAAGPVRRSPGGTEHRPGAASRG
ncbi:MAG TPA: alpha/beta hydrolase [Blastococcus sp.]|nr:alpha/beta hydrolase [Blastococcus sp.]